MQPGEFFTWNRLLHIDVVDGSLPTQLLAERTLSLTYIDRSKDFDHIEWELDNRDGLLTRPEHIAAGMIVRLKIGYINGGFPWKAFIINRLRGGVGVWGPKRGPVGDSESKITFHGRNRNAPGGKTSKYNRRTAQAPAKKPKKSFPATSDVTRFEMLLDQKDKPGFIPAKSTAEAVRKIAFRNGFEESYALIQPTEDTIEGVTLQKGRSDGQFLAELAQQRNFSFKIEGDVLHWHASDWEGAKLSVVDVLTYGAGMDIINLTIDCDFQLPLPKKVTAHSYSFRNRAFVVSEVDRSKDSHKLQMAVGFMNDIYAYPDENKALLHDETLVITSDNLKTASNKAMQRFLQANQRAFQLSIHCVGNPKLLAGKLVKVAGTGSPLVDGVWMIGEARHVVNGTDYTTDVKLGPVKKGSIAGKDMITPGVISEPKRSQDDHKPRLAVYFLSMPNVTPKSLR